MSQICAVCIEWKYANLIVETLRVLMGWFCCICYTAVLPIPFHYCTFLGEPYIEATPRNKQRTTLLIDRPVPEAPHLSP